MNVYLSIICHNDYWSYVEKKVVDFEQQLNARRLSDPISQIYWKEPQFYEFREGLLTGSSLDVVEEKVKALCAGFGEVKTQMTTQEKSFSVFSSIPEMQVNRKRIFIVITISDLASL